MKKFFLTLLLTAMMCVPFTTSAQVTIGSGNPPSQWSVLDLDNSEQAQPLALHLPRLTTQERDEELTPTLTEEARGLMIFRTDVKRVSSSPVRYIGCLEVWNGEIWLSFCVCDDPENLTN